jgi:hypothetical protein
MTTKKIVPLGHQLFEAGKLILRIPSSRKKRELQPSLVGVVNGLEELLGIRGVNEHRNPEPGARVPERIELRVIDSET